MYNSLGLVVTALLWGVTNPFIKRGTKGIRDVKANTIAGQVYSEIQYVLSNWKYVAPWLVNQCGSVVYLVCLQRARLSLAVPVTNSLTFVVTAATGYWLGEQPLTKRSLLGILLIISGTALCYTEPT